MKENKSYNPNSKTEFLFESDADKELLRQASIKPKKNRFYLKIIFSSLLLSILIIAISFNFSNHRLNEFIKANIVEHNKNSKNIVEKTNEFCLSLKEIHNDYNNKYKILINKANPISNDYVNNYNIVSVENNMYDGILLEEETYNAYLKLKKNLNQRGYYINITTGYRSFNNVKKVYDSIIDKKGVEYAEKYIASPGSSEHNSGLAIDFIITKNKNWIKTDYNSDEYEYIKNIAHIYGFIFRYPKNKEKITGYDYDPDHIRYVGKDLAKYLKKTNLTLEEYYKQKEL